jgi:hypothetical protein
MSDASICRIIEFDLLVLEEFRGFYGSLLVGRLFTVLQSHMPFEKQKKQAMRDIKSRNNTYSAMSRIEKIRHGQFL